MLPTRRFLAAINPYKAKRPWPPDLTNLSHRHQFALEKRYRRRAKLKWARPKLMLATRIAQWVGGIAVLVYGTLYYPWDGEQGKAFKGLREWYRYNVEEMVAGRRILPRLWVEQRGVEEKSGEVRPR